MSPAQTAVAALERQFGTAIDSSPTEQNRTHAEKQAVRQRFEGHFGAVDLGYPNGADNESIDADLAREFADIFKKE